MSHRSTTITATVASTLLATAGFASAQTTGPGTKDGSQSGNLYAATNALSGNAIRTFHRDNSGRLKLVRDTPTGGMGSGAFEQSANALVLGDRDGESSPNNLTNAEDLLFAVNTGSNSLAVLRADGDQMRLVDTAPTGSHPLSVTVNRGVVYVLNGGGPSGTGIPPSITGYRVSITGRLTPIADSTRPVSGGPVSGSSQISFNPAGDVLVVTEKTANVLTSYRVRDGVAGPPISNPNSAGSVGPFGFTFTKAGRLLSAENVGGAPMQGGVNAFRVNDDGTLTAVQGTVGNGQSDTCWVVVTDDQRFAYATNAQSNTVSSYTVGPQGTLTLLAGNAASTDELPAVGPTILPGDITLSRDSRFLYERNVMDGDINAYAVGADGSLKLVQRIDNALPVGAIGVAGT